MADMKRGGSGRRDGQFGPEPSATEARGKTQQRPAGREDPTAEGEPELISPVIQRPSTTKSPPTSPGTSTGTPRANAATLRRSGSPRDPSIHFRAGDDREPVVREYITAMLPRRDRPGASSLITHPASLRTAAQLLGIAILLAMWAVDSSARGAVRNVVEHSGIYLGAIGPIAAFLAMVGALFRRRDIPREIIDRTLCLGLAALALLGTGLLLLGHPDPTGVALSSAALLVLPVQMLTRRPHFDRAWLLGERTYRRLALWTFALGIGVPLLTGTLLGGFTRYSVAQLDELDRQLGDRNGARCQSILDSDAPPGTGFPSGAAMLFGSHDRGGDLGRALATCAISTVDPSRPRMLDLRSTDGKESLVKRDTNEGLQNRWAAERAHLSNRVFASTRWLAAAERESYAESVSQTIDRLTGEGGCSNPDLALELDLLRAAAGPKGASACRNDYLDGTDQAAAQAALAHFAILGTAGFYRMDLAGGDPLQDGGLQALMDRTHAAAQQNEKRRTLADTRTLVYARPWADGKLRKVAELRILDAESVTETKFDGQTGHEVYLYLYGEDIEWPWIREAMAEAWGFEDVRTPGSPTCDWGKGKGGRKSVVADLRGGGHLHVFCYFCDEDEKNKDGTVKEPGYRIESGPESGRSSRVMRINYGDQSPCEQTGRSTRRKYGR